MKITRMSNAKDFFAQLKPELIEDESNNIRWKREIENRTTSNTYVCVDTECTEEFNELLSLHEKKIIDRSNTPYIRPTKYTHELYQVLPI